MDVGAQHQKFPEDGLLIGEKSEASLAPDGGPGPAM